MTKQFIYTVSIGTKKKLSILSSHTVLKVGGTVFDLICKDKKSPLFAFWSKQGLVRKRSISHPSFKQYTWQTLELDKKQFDIIHEECFKNLYNPPKYNSLGVLGGHNCVTFCIYILQKGNIQISNKICNRLPFLFHKHLSNYILKGGYC